MVDPTTTTTRSNMAIISRRGNGIQEDRGINKIILKRRMLLITTVIPTARNVGESTREIAVLEPIAAFCVARKVILSKIATPISRLHRTIREVKEISFMQHN